MKKQTRRKGIMVLYAVFLGIFLMGCGKESGDSLDKKMNQTDSSEGKEDKTNQLDSSADNGKIANAQNTEKPKEEYETLYKKKIEINNKRKSVSIQQNSHNVSDVVMKIGNQDVKLKRVSIDTGYAHAKAKALDCTDDGKEELVLLLRGGASGALMDIQIFEEEKEWKELSTPPELWEDDFVTLNQEGNYLSVEVKATDSKKKIKMKSKNDFDKYIVGYRTCKMTEKGMEISYELWLDGNPDPIGQVKQSVTYNKDTDTFEYAKTLIDISK